MFRTVKTEGPSGTSGRTATGFDASGGGGGGGGGWAGAGGERGDLFARLVDEGALEDAPFGGGESHPRLRDMVVRGKEVQSFHSVRMGGAIILGMESQPRG
jgi:hypothetical protein